MLVWVIVRIANSCEVCDICKFYQKCSRLEVHVSAIWNVTSYVDLTCDQASYFCGGKERLIRLLDYLSVASPEPGLFSDWSRNKRYLELSHNWFPVWQSMTSRELMNSIMTSDDPSEVSEFLSALNASPESFVHKALKDEQIECIHRIVCHGRDVLAVLPTGLGKSATYQFS